MARAALITGAAGGIGLATARALAAGGLGIGLVDAAAATLEEAAADLRATGATVATAVADVADETAAVAAFASVEEALGPVAVLVCCAGIMPGTPDGPTGIAETSLEEWDRVQAVNCRGTFLFVREMLRRRARLPVRNGRIVTLSSAAGQLGGYRGSASYVASKAALLGFTKIAAREAAPLGITVNCVAPGPVDTPMFDAAVRPEAVAPLLEKVPLGRIGSPEDVAGAVCYLADEATGWVTGATLDVNGGYRMQ